MSLRNKGGGQVISKDGIRYLTTCQTAKCHNMISQYNHWGQIDLS